MSDGERIAALVERYRAAYEARDEEGCADIFAADATVLSPWAPPARGRTAIAQAHRDWFGAGERNKEMAIADLVVDGDLAACLVHYRADAPATGKDGTEAVFGAGQNALCKGADGAWRIRLCSLTDLGDDRSGTIWE